MRLYYHEFPKTLFISFFLYELVREHWLNMQLKCSTGLGKITFTVNFFDIASKSLSILDLKLRLYYHDFLDFNQYTFILRTCKGTTASMQFDCPIGFVHLPPLSLELGQK